MVRQDDNSPSSLLFGQKTQKRPERRVAGPPHQLLAASELQYPTHAATEAPPCAASAQHVH
eukprot:1157461-Pelagomonas_calceolata.AAC.2